jgi:hypothetical protein
MTLEILSFEDTEKMNSYLEPAVEILNPTAQIPSGYGWKMSAFKKTEESISEQL